MSAALANQLTSPGRLIKLRGREWVVLPSDDTELLLLKPLGGSEAEITGVFLPLGFSEDEPHEAEFPQPQAADLGSFSSARLLLESARLAFRQGAGPFRSLAKLSFRPRAYQMVPLIMALRQETVRLLIGDDVGVGKTIEALLIAKEMLERRTIKRFAVVCLPHLCEQWQEEIRDKTGIEAVIIRSNTQARLDREIFGDVSVYQHYPFQVISIDYLKAPNRRDVFANQGPELVIVDEVHTCARPTGAAPSAQMRHDLVRRISEDKKRHLVLLTATPHSGKPEEFQSLLGLLDSSYEALDLPKASPEQHRLLAAHFVQRRRGDVLKWLDEDTPFPTRDSGEIAYRLSPAYAAIFQRLLGFASRLVTEPSGSKRAQRVHFWTALGLLRGVMSSPSAGVEMLTRRLSLEAPPGDEIGPDEENAVHDTPDGHMTDATPGDTLDQLSWSESQRRTLSELASALETLSGPKSDFKIKATAETLAQWLNQGFQPVVFCRYLATARYVGEQLRPILTSKFKDLQVEVVTSEDPDEIRRERVTALGKAPRRVLIATDCLSEGINLQDSFNAVLHYDLPWNPNRLEQREGRVDRFGQDAETVKAYLLHGQDNPVDGIVLGVILRKVREIRRATGITVPFPEDSRTIIDSIAQAILLNPKRVEDASQLEFDLDGLDETKAAKTRITHKIEDAARRETATRSIFAQHAIRADQIESDLRENAAAIGDVVAVERFVLGTLQELLGVQVTPKPKGFVIHTGNLVEKFRAHLPTLPQVLVSFLSPTPSGHLYLGRNHPLVEQLCQHVMARALDHTTAAGEQFAARSSVLRTKAVMLKTTLLLFRCRDVIGQKNGPARIVAEEMLVWGYRGSPSDNDFLTEDEAHKLLDTARPASALSPQSQSNFLDNELSLLPSLRDEFDKVAESRCKKLVEAHERYSRFFSKTAFEVVHPVLPMDVMGVYVLLPEGPSN